MPTPSAKTSGIEQEMTTLLAGKDFSNEKLRILLVAMILKYLEGSITLTYLLTTGADIYQQHDSQLSPDLLEATSTLAYLAEQVRDKKPHSFVEHQKIEDKLVTLLQNLQEEKAL